ncbi:MAG: hypothetical protein AB8U25_07110 [Rickettsiales endosymbiont of Dermacentor nuttalli]
MSKLSDALITGITKIDLDSISDSSSHQLYISYSQMSERQKNLLNQNVKEFFPKINLSQNDNKISILELKKHCKI